MTSTEKHVEARAGGPDPAVRGRRNLRAADLPTISAGIVLVLLALAAVWPELLSTHPADEIDPISAFAPPSSEHLLGTDQLGRDIYSRIVHGTRLSLLIGIGATSLAVLVGGLLGVLAATSGRVIREIVLRITDILLAFPGLLLALLVVAVLGPGSLNAAMAIGVSLVPGFIRLARSQALIVQESDYVRAARLFGYRRMSITLRHVLPNALPPVLVLATVSSGSAIIISSSLGFLGLGPRPPSPEWGSMLAESRDFLDTSWIMAACPGIAVTLTAVTINVVGRRLRQRFEGRAVT